jgi:hypothetical protein
MLKTWVNHVVDYLLSLRQYRYTKFLERKGSYAKRRLH